MYISIYILYISDDTYIYDYITLYNFVKTTDDLIRERLVMYIIDIRTIWL